MPLSERGTTLTASASAEGICVYTKTKQGRITQARNTITQSQLSQAVKQNPKDEGSHGVLDLVCSPDSTLCGVAWDSYTQSIFYQDDQGSICEWRKLNDGDWVNFSTPLNGLRGTNIAVVHACNGNRVMLFYQGVDYHIYCAHAQLRQWGPQIKIAKATKSTGIGATSRKDLSEVRLYFQDDTLSICEYRGSFTDTKNLTKVPLPLKTEGPIEDITAISWQVGSETKTRLYLQDSANNIIDYSNDGAHWAFGTLKELCFPNADIIAVLRDIGIEHEFCINVFWVGEDQKLYQRVRVGDTLDEDRAHEIMEVSDVGTFAGSLSGERFSDIDGNSDIRYVRAVNVRVLGEDVISAIGFEFSDGTKTPMHGGKSGDVKRFELVDKEDITYMSIVTSSDSKRIQGLRFGTSNGRVSDWYGLKNDSRHQSWSKSGHPLIGFDGAADDVVKGLRPLWATRLSTADVTRVPELVTEARNLHGEAEVARSGLQTLLDQAIDIKKEASNNIFSNSLGNIVNLTSSIEYLGALTSEAYLGIDEQRQERIDSQRGTCSNRADTVEKAFQSAFQRITEYHSRCAQLTKNVEETLVASAQRAEKIDPLLMEVQAIRNMIEPEFDKSTAELKWAKGQADSARTNSVSHVILECVDIALCRAQANYDSRKTTLEEIDEWSKKLNNLRPLIENTRAETEDVRVAVREASNSLKICTQVSDRFNKTYGDGKPLNNHQNASVLANQLLKLVTLVFEEPSLKVPIGIGSKKIEPDLVLRALRAVARVGN